MKIEELAAELEIDDVEGLSTALPYAVFAYDGDGRPAGHEWSETRTSVAALAYYLNEATRLLDNDGVAVLLREHDTDEGAFGQETSPASDRLNHRVQKLRELRDLARAASDWSPPKRRDDHQEKADLRGFVVDLAAYWRNDLGREFTLDFHQDVAPVRDGIEPANDMAFFVVGAASICGIEATDNEIRNAMAPLISPCRGSRDLS